MSALIEKAAGAMDELFPTLPWKIRLSYSGESRTFGSGQERAELACRREEPLRDLARWRLPSFLDRYVAGEVDFSGDIYALVGARNHVRRNEDWKVGLWIRMRHLWTACLPSSVRRKLVAVSSHYDLPNEFILSYLDKRTRAYSCAMWKDPANIVEPFDETLEDAQYRKFRMAAEALEIQPDDRFLDIGCGYGFMTHLAETEFGCRHALGITL